MSDPIVMPVEAYTSEKWFLHEQKNIFSNTWQFAGFIEDVANPGDFITVQAGNNNIAIVRGRDQRLRAFHNICRHRGTQLLRAVGKSQKALTCPYHDWTYSLNGELLSVPEEATEFPNIDKSKLCLHKASVETWLGMIWVHPDPEAQSLMHWLGGVQDYIGPHRIEELVEYPDARTDHSFCANWKIVVENYIDGYHLAHLHSTTLHMYDHQKQQTGFIGPHFAFYEPLSKDYENVLEQASPLPLLDHFTDENPIGAYVPMLFPNLGITGSENSWSIFHIIPIAADKTRVVTRTRVKNSTDAEFAEQEKRANNSEFYIGYGQKYPDSNSKEDTLNSGDFMAEDILVCEAQQRSMYSPYFSIGASAKNQEASVRGFQQIVLEYLKET